jgi:nucleoside triphosphate diphosphatase
MDTLRSPHGCPWDREQTHESLRPFLLEETYEALEALDRGDLDRLPGELGDVLFQCVFHAQIAAEAGRFDFADALDAISAKLVRRHPHVFTPAGTPLPRDRKSGRLATSGAVLQQWERLKAKEQDAAAVPKRVLGGVPRAMPALLRAYEIGTRVASVGFDWPRALDVVDKIDEEVRELREVAGHDSARAAEELGDLLFSIANLARKLGIEPESALRAANDKFTRRFNSIEGALTARGTTVHDVGAADLESAWAAVKATEHDSTTSVPFVTEATSSASTSTAVPSSSARVPRGRRSRR